MIVITILYKICLYYFILIIIIITVWFFGNCWTNKTLTITDLFKKYLEKMSKLFYSITNITCISIEPKIIALLFFCSDDKLSHPFIATPPQWSMNIYIRRICVL